MIGGFEAGEPLWQARSHSQKHGKELGEPSEAGLWRFLVWK
jgi:hypothetical protein